MPTVRRTRSLSYPRPARLLALLAAALVAVPLTAPLTGPLAAQAPRANRTLISINPLGLPFKWISAEVERKASQTITVGASVSYSDFFGDASYTSFDAKFRVYPNEEAFRGFALGLSAGITRASEEFSDSDGRSETAPSLGVTADYNWILGKSNRFLVGTGVGAKRLFGDKDNFNDVNFAYPTFRFQVGMIF